MFVETDCGYMLNLDHVTKIYKSYEDEGCVLGFLDKDGATLGILTVDKEDADTILPRICGRVIPAQPDQYIVSVCMADPEEQDSRPSAENLYIESSPLIGWAVTGLYRHPITAWTLDPGIRFIRNRASPELIALDGSDPVGLDVAKARAVDIAILKWEFGRKRPAKDSAPSTHGDSA